MLRKLDNKTVQGNGFTVTVPTIHEVRYTAGEKTLTVEIEGGTGQNDQVEWDVYSDTMRGWLPPHHLDRFTYEDKQRVLRNISESLRVLGMKHQIV